MSGYLVPFENGEFRVRLLDTNYLIRWPEFAIRTESGKGLALDKLPKALVVIGGGVIGLEFANFFHAAGTQVTIVEMMPKIAPVVDDEERLRFGQ